MSRNPVASYTMRGFRMGAVDFKDFLWEALLDPAANATMGDTAENLARQYQITRPEVDAFAARSFERALAAQASGFLAGEIAAVKSEPFEREGFAAARPQAQGREGARRRHPCAPLTGRDARDHPPGFRRSADRRQFLRHRRRRGGGTGRVLRLRAQVRQAPLARIVAGATVGVPPDIMGIGPVPAIKACSSARACAQAISTASRSTRPSAPR